MFEINLYYVVRQIQSTIVKVDKLLIINKLPSCGFSIINQALSAETQNTRCLIRDTSLNR